MPEHPRPSDHSRRLVQGAYDVHVHIAPDVMRRRITDLELAARFADLGMAGFVLKSHYVPTAERASLVRAVHPEVDAVGAVTLNASVGGMNPVAVEIAARSGARFVWMPTVDSANQRSSLAAAPEGSTPPMWAALQQDLRDRGIDSPPVEVLGADGEVALACGQVLDLIARHDLTLATGHLHGDESARVIAAARDRGVRRIVVTHPEFTSQRIPVEAQRALVPSGALLERCLTTPLTGKVSWADWLGNIRAAGPEHSVISSDLGQPFNPPVEDGLAIAADILLGDGFGEAEVRTMIVHNSRFLVGAAPLDDAPAAHHELQETTP
ncbi:DUF6282 family protein [Agromyces archimandritae]|uniref:Cytosolic protein n=1 Tax=Agromyces archimandritae TaxID=2781962 RepID=A0A975FL66_9MICO|nr:DUF6282 family protein [Agromyces archimandritae]QTX04533.1 cytosolic protein [Agromyces archimandritae]